MKARGGEARDRDAGGGVFQRGRGQRVLVVVGPWGSFKGLGEGSRWRSTRNCAGAGAAGNDRQRVAVVGLVRGV